MTIISELLNILCLMSGEFTKFTSLFCIHHQSLFVLLFCFNSRIKINLAEDVVKMARMGIERNL